MQLVGHDNMCVIIPIFLGACCDFGGVTCLASMKLLVMLRPTSLKIRRWNIIPLFGQH